MTKVVGTGHRLYLVASIVHKVMRTRTGGTRPGGWCASDSPEKDLLVGEVVPQVQRVEASRLSGCFTEIV